MKEGIDDGFPALFKVINIMTDIGTAGVPASQRDIYGNEIPDRIYTNSDYDYNIIIEDRIQQVAAEITSYLKSTDRMSKLSYSAPTRTAAGADADGPDQLQRRYGEKEPGLCVRITGSDAYGKSKLKYFISNILRALSSPPHQSCPPEPTANGQADRAGQDDRLHDGVQADHRPGTGCGRRRVRPTSRSWTSAM
ncbi:MAG: hypothetical protein ACLTYN_03535 [Dysosmobacter welbionis]